MVDFPARGAGMEPGVKVTLKPLPNNEADKAIAELKPPEIVVVIVEVQNLARRLELEDRLLPAESDGLSPTLLLFLSTVRTGRKSQVSRATAVEAHPGGSPAIPPLCLRGACLQDSACTPCVHFRDHEPSSSRIGRAAISGGRASCVLSQAYRFPLIL